MRELKKLGLLYNIYKTLHRVTKQFVYSLPIPEATKSFIAKNLSRRVPVKRLLKKTELPNPIGFRES